MPKHHSYNHFSGHPCDTPNCTGRRSRGSHSRFCSACRGRLRRYGVAHGRRVHRETLEPFRKQAREFLHTHSDTPQVQAALAVLTRYFALSQRKSSQGGKWVRYAVSAGLTPYEALWRSLAVWLLQQERPYTITDDKFLTNELGRAIVNARPMPQRISTEGKVTGTREVTSTPRLEVGQFLRESLGLFYVRVGSAIDGERRNRVENTEIMARSFTGTLIYG